LRLVVEAQDWEAAVQFYRDALGLPLREGFANDEAAQMILEAGSASIELVHPELPSATADRDSPTELDSPPSPRLRLVIRSDDARETTTALEAVGAEMVESPHLTTIGSVKARVLGPDQMPITVFQPLSDPDFAEVPPTAD
jgi:catechol 2,3-dioxygenase-like lactoylglutathione lyase family enzyme